MGFVDDWTVLGDGGQYYVCIVCEKLRLAGTVTITCGVASLQVS